MTDRQPAEFLRCIHDGKGHSRGPVHVVITDNRTRIRRRCKERHCPDAVYAKYSGRQAVHVWDISGPIIRCWTEFEEPGTVTADRFQEVE